MSDDREIVCSRIVFVDSEFDAKKGQGERPGPPVCICAIEIDQNGRETEHRLAAPYPAQPPWDRGDPFLAIGFALSAEAGSFLHVGWSFPMPAIDLYAEYMVIHNTEMSRGGDSKQPGQLNSSLSALRRRRNGQGVQGGYALARLYEDRSHSGRTCAPAGLLHRRQPNSAATVSRNAAVYRPITRTDPWCLHDGD